METGKQKKRVFILGGGFGGVHAARDLGKRAGNMLDVTLITNKDYFEYYPALYRVVTGASPIEVCVPLREVIPGNVRVLIDPVASADIMKKEVYTESGAVHGYDALVIALGSETTYFNLPGLQELSLGFKSINEALNLKKHIQSLFAEHAHPDQKELVSHFHIVIVGGGPSGVEVAGDLTSYMRELAGIYKVDPSLITIDLIESNPRLVPTLPEKASVRILARLRKLGVNVYLNRALVKEEVEEVYLKDMSMKAKTVIWTAGTQLSKVIQKIPNLPMTPKKRIDVDEFMHAKGFDDVYVVGDAAATPYSGLAQTAIYDGKYVAKTIAMHARGKVPKPYYPHKIAYVIPVGSWWAAFIIGPLHIYGPVAYIVRHLVDFFFFIEMVSAQKLFSLFFEGWKYRKTHLPK